ncbi:MAG: hypothetical protein ACSLFF_01060 [Solirubrobacterales bacterium]
MSRLKSIVLLSLAATALSCGSAAAATIGAVAPTTAGNDCTNADCTWVQVSTHPGAPSYAIPFDGVATSFSVRVGTTAPFGDSLRFYTFEPGSSALKFIPSADSGPIALPAASAGLVVNLPIRQTVRAGQMLGLGLDLAGTTNGQFLATNPVASDDVRQFNGFPTLGQEVSQNGDSAGSHLNMRAVIEPDADHDGHGDETQDGCPTDRSDQGPCTAPAISDFKYSLNKFAVKKNGPVLSASATATGTTVIITLSKAARVQFEMKLKAPGRKVGKSCKKRTRCNRKKKKCTRYPRTYKFTRDLPAGTSNLGFSGRIEVGSRTRSLALGSYVATATPFSTTAQLGGSPAKTSFKVIRASKPH